MATERKGQGVGVLASDREMIRWLNGDVLTVLLDVSNEISSPGQQSMARGAIRRVEAIVDRLHSHGPAVAELVAAVADVYGNEDSESCDPGCPSCRIRAALAPFQSEATDMTTKDTGGSSFKVGDRVEVIAVHECDEDYFSLGATGAVARIDRDGDCWIDFDSGAKTYGFKAHWCANPSQLAARKEES